MTPAKLSARDSVTSKVFHDVEAGVISDMQRGGKVGAEFKLALSA